MNTDECTTLHSLCAKRELTHTDFETAKLLIKNRVCVNTKDTDGCTALHLACDKAQLSRVDFDLIKYLVDCGSDVNAKTNNEYTPLITVFLSCCKRSDTLLNVLQLLVNNGAHINTDTHKGDLLLHYAIRNNRRHMFDSFLETKGIDLNARSESGVSAIHIAVEQRQVTMLRQLLDKGANVDAQFDNGYTTLHMITHLEFLEGDIDTQMLECLGEYNVDVNVQDDDGRTPAHILCSTTFQGKSKSPMLKFLIAGGADFNVQNDDGETSLHLAIKDGHYWMSAVDYVMEGGGDIDRISFDIRHEWFEKYCDPVHRAAVLTKIHNNVTSVF